MLESLRVRSAICVQLRSGPLGSWVDPFVVALQEAGYTPSVVRRHVRGAAVFGAWLARQGMAVDEVNEPVVSRFAGAYRRWRSPSRAHGRPNEIVTSVHLFAAFVWTHGAPFDRPARGP